LPHRHFLVAITAEKEPLHFHEAVKDARWKEAMQYEIQALEQNRTWTLQGLLPGKKALGCKWVYCIKYHLDGTIERFKVKWSQCVLS